MERFANTFQKTPADEETNTSGFFVNQERKMQSPTDLEFMPLATPVCVPGEDIDTRKSVKITKDITTLITETHDNMRESEKEEEMDQREGKTLDLPAKGGVKEESWEIDMGDEVVEIPKPKDPLADLREMTKDKGLETPEEEKKRTHNAMAESFGEEE